MILLQSNEVVKVEDLSPRSYDLSLKAKVLELGERREVSNRNTGEQHEVMEVLIGDETGCVYFSAWNEDIEKIEVGKTYQFENAKTILFRGHIRLSLGRNGNFEEIDEDIPEVDTENNVSDQEHERPRSRYGDNRRGGGYSAGRYNNRSW